MFNGIIKKTGVIKGIKRYKKNCELEILSSLKFLKFLLKEIHKNNKII